MAYFGSPVLLEELLYKPRNSLIVQSLHSRLGVETINGDGFGVGWYGTGDSPGVFRSTEPAWSDRNLRNLAAHTAAARILTHIRASSGSPVQQTNCHPFRHGRWLWIHNGLIGDFPAVKRDLALAVDPALFPEIEGSTDSELLFFLTLTFGLEGDSPTAVTRTVSLVEATGRRHGVAYRVHMTVATSDGDSLWAFRCSNQGQSRRSSTASMSPPCVTNIRTTRRCTSSPTTRASSYPSHWEIYTERGGRYPSRRV